MYVYKGSLISAIVDTIHKYSANTLSIKTVDFAAITKACFRKPRETEQITPTITTDILEELSCRYPQIMPTQKTKIAIAVALKSLGYKSTHTHKGSAYYVVPKKYKAA
ncbi:MAG: DUF3874 domain-containing protein [Prevotella sp.]|nr:DUF3874 domain-containing protein [Prevotella sp.]